MKKFLFVIFVIFAMVDSVNAQTMMNGLMDKFRFTKITDGTYSRNDLKLSDIQGSPYLDEEFLSGKITTREGTVYTDLPLRYNGFTDDLEFQKGEDSYNIDPKVIVKRAEFGSSVLGCLEYYDGSKIKNGFFEILTEGKAILLVRYTVKFIEKEAVKAFAEPRPARFDEPVKDYYMSVEGAPAKLITNKKGLLELFGSKKDEMESYISKNKLSVKKDDDLIKIVVNFNSL
jgi:hypothetical protein